MHMNENVKPSNIFSQWSKGIDSEREFWSSWFETKGLAWPDDYAERIKPKRDLSPWLQKLLRETAGNVASNERASFRIIDVGSGPISKIGWYMSDADLEIIAADPLAFIYAELCEQHGVKPVPQTEFAPAEDLSSFYAPSSFDLVHCCNALDHSFEPMRGIIEMLRVVKVGHVVFLAHNRNEAENEKYEGFHQHNFEVIDGRFVIWNKTERLVVEEHLPIEFEIENTMRNHFVTNKITKRSEFSDIDDTPRRDKRLREIYQSVIRAFATSAVDDRS
jgi:SAM-dependent methyltransferase